MNMNMNMRSWMLVMILVILLLEEWGSQCHGCREDERFALLEIKSSFSRAHQDSLYLPRWGIDNDCCNWNRVRCNETTKRIISLDLGHIMNLDSGGWYLNTSLFLPFKDLKTLYLTENQILGCIKNEGFEKLSSLANLQYLNLKSNKFNNSIMSSLHDFSSLKMLDLSQNKLNGIIDIRDLNYLTSLETLYLDGNEIKGFKSFQGDDEEVLRLSYCKSLYLSNNSLDNSILSSLKGLSSLKQLFLSYNQLKGSVNMTELNALSQLEMLDLSGNEISRFVAAGENKNSSNLSWLGLQEISTNAGHVLELQSLLGSFPHLYTLDLGANNLRGASIGQGSHHRNNLEYLYLDDSSVDENFLQSIGVLVSLKFLFMRGLNGSLLVQGLCHLNQVQGLYISGNNLSSTLPPCIANLTSLRDLDLSSNQLTGNISLSLLRSMTSLEILFISHNQFQIPITLSPFFNHTKLRCLSAEGNNIFPETEQNSLAPKFQLTRLSLSGYGHGGKFPKFLYYQHKLEEVDLSHIQLSEGFPYWLLANNTNLQALFLVNSSLSGELRLPRHSHTSLMYLDISENHLHGHVPAQIGAHFPNLQLLNISGNSFIGSIPLSLSNLSSIQYLDLSNNQLSGEVPGQLATSCLMLTMLVLSNNHLQGQIFSRNWQLQRLVSLQMDGNLFIGTIPDSLYNGSSLRILKLSHNNLQGTLPRWIGNMSALQVLDLSANNISGSLLPNFPPGIIQVYLSKNRLQGSLENAFYKSSNLVALDLSCNYFTGNIPKWVETLSNLSYLLLGNNNFEGQIPIQLCNLDKLRLIDFSHNYLSGHIPPCLRSGITWDTTRSPQSIQITYETHFHGGYSISFGPIVISPFELRAQFTTRSISYSYKGKPLLYMTGIDLSHNNLIGEIPPEFGSLRTIKVLNLSRNNLRGSIPPTLSNLKEVESLDLSYNNLDGKIPPQLTQLHQLAAFTVAHNNLSGKTPDMVAQFATFDNSSYKDNPFLCGPPLTKTCNGHPSPPLSPKNSGEHEEETGLINMDAFYASFLASYSVVLLGIVAVLYINPHWRRVWFHFVELCINKCYYFIVDNLPMLSKHRASQSCV